ncbi:hypothetical protein, partial [Haloarcula onubensis]
MTGEEILYGEGQKVTNQNYDELDTVDGTVVREDTVRDVQTQALSSLNEQTGGEGQAFSTDDIEVTTAQRDGQQVVTAELTTAGQDKLTEERRRMTEEQLFSQVQSDTEAQLDRGEDITFTESDGQVRAALTDEGRKQRVAAQNEGVSAEDLFVADDGTVRGRTQTPDITYGQANQAFNRSAQDVARSSSTKERDTEIDRAVSRFEGLTGTDIPGEGQAIPDIDVSREIEDTAGVSVPSAGDIGDGTQSGLEDIAGAAGRNQYVSGTVDALREAEERVPTDQAVGALAASVAVSPLGQIVGNDRVRKTADDIATLSRERAGEAADAAGDVTIPFTTTTLSQSPGLFPRATRQTAQAAEAAGGVTIPFTTTTLSQSPGLFPRAARQTAQAAEAAGNVDAPFTNTDINDVPAQSAEAAGGVTIPFTSTPLRDSPGLFPRAARQTAQAADTAGEATIPFTSTTFSRAPGLVPRAAGEAAQAGQVAGDAVEALRVTDELGAQSDAEARAEARRIRQNPLSQFGRAVETDLAQFTSDRPDDVVAERVAESRRQDSIEASKQGPAASPAPAVGRNPLGAVRGIGSLGRAVSGGGQAARTAAGIAGLIGSAVAVDELEIDRDQDDSELTTPTEGQRREIEVPEEEVAVNPEELGVPREALQDDRAEISGPDGTRVTDDGEIIIPAGTTAVSAGTRQEEEEREDVVEEEAEEDAENAGETAEEEEE